jgi:SAM-dependent methyltransferase
LRFAPFPFKHGAGVVLAPLLDRFLYRHPFEGGSARRYAEAERPAFGDLDDRLLDWLNLSGTRSLLDLGCGPATFSERAAARHPELTVVAIDPSHTFGSLLRGRGRLAGLRAAGEALPLADASIDTAMCLSSIRHVRDRAQTFRELRRVVHGRVVIVELDPAAEPHRVAAHADRLGSALLRRAFGPLVLRTAPSAESILAIAKRAGFGAGSVRPDPIQPVYIMELR